MHFVKDQLEPRTRSYPQLCEISGGLKAPDILQALAKDKPNHGTCVQHCCLNHEGNIPTPRKNKGKKRTLETQHTRQQREEIGMEGVTPINSKCQYTQAERLTVRMQSIISVVHTSLPRYFSTVDAVAVAARQVVFSSTHLPAHAWPVLVLVFGEHGVLLRSFALPSAEHAVPRVVSAPA
jgi:hypothetical protein